MNKEVKKWQKHGEVEVNPEVLNWARVGRNLKSEEVEEQLGLEKGIIKKWESGEARPSVENLRDLAEVYRRPLAVFLLPVSET